MNSTLGAMSSSLGATNAAQKLGSRLSSGAAATYDVAAGAVAGVRSSLAKKGAIVVFVLLCLVVVALIVAYIVYRIRRSDLQSTMVLAGPTRLFDMTTAPVVVDKAKLPQTLNGQEYSFSFWVFLTDMVTTADPHLLFLRGGDGTDVAGASPLVFMDGGTNKLYISVSTNQAAADAPAALSALVADAPSTAVLPVVAPSATGYLTATVDYVPLQRWVHVAFVVQDNLLTVFLDGELYGVRDVQDMTTAAAPTKRPVFGPCSGSAYVGYLKAAPEQTHGFLGKLLFFNYALMQRDVLTAYTQGPAGATGVLGTMGVPDYGIRWPIYRVDTSDT
jgi:hypothetical protein